MPSAGPRDTHTCHNARLSAACCSSTPQHNQLLRTDSPCPSHVIHHWFIKLFCTIDSSCTFIFSTLIIKSVSTLPACCHRWLSQVCWGFSQGVVTRGVTRRSDSEAKAPKAPKAPKSEKVIFSKNQKPSALNCSPTCPSTFLKVLGPRVSFF